MNTTYTIVLTDGLLRPVGHIIAVGRNGWTGINLTHRFNAVSSGAFTVAAHPWLLAAVNTPGCRAVVIRDDSIELAGPVEVPEFGYQAQRDGLSGPGLVTVNFADDLAGLGMRLVYPNPAQAATAQSVARYGISGVNAETAMRNLVTLNAGPGALTARRLPGLVLGPLAIVGSPVTDSFRFDPLLDALRRVAVAGGGLGFRTRQTGEMGTEGSPAIEFQVYQPPDLSAGVWFSRALNNLREVQWQPSAPTVTVAIVGGAEAGALRTIRERTNSVALAAGWGRRETFVDSRGAQNATEMDTAGDEALANGGPSEDLKIVAVDTAAQGYRSPYQLGSKVSVEVFDGVVRADIIGTVDIAVTAKDGEKITPTIGPPDTTTARTGAALQRDVVRRLNQLAAGQ